MDTSPIPSPAFSNVTQSTAMTSSSSIRMNVKMYLADVKNVMLSRSCSFKVQRVKLLLMITSYEEAYNKTHQDSIFICDYLFQNEDPHAHRLATELAETFRPIHTEFKAYTARIHLALDAFNPLTKLEYRSMELAAEVDQLAKELQRCDGIHKRALTGALELKKSEYAEFKMNYVACTDNICHEIFFEMCDNIRKHQMLVLDGVKSIRQALLEFPNLYYYLALVVP